MFPNRSAPRHVTGDETRARLLAAATEVFLEDGFRAARVESIARRAGLRLSAINYHFGGKEGLYLAVLRQHADTAVAQTPLTPALSDAPQRERLQVAISAILRRFLDRHTPSRIAQLMLRELSSPTAALDTMIEHFTLPQARTLQALLGEVLGPRVPQLPQDRALFSLMGQCMVYATARPLIERVAPDALPQTAEDLDTIAHHVTDFTWAGLQALRQHWENHHAP